MSGVRVAVLLALGMLCSACPTIWSDECLSVPWVSGRGSFDQRRCEPGPDEARRKAAERAAERAEAEREAAQSAAVADEPDGPEPGAGRAPAGREYSGPLLASPGRHVPEGAGRSQSAFMTVRCWRNNKPHRTWSGNTRWSGPVPAEYSGTFERGVIKWEGDVAEGIRVDTRPDGSGGKSIRAFCGAGAQAVFLYVVAGHAATGENPHGGSGKKKSKTASKAPPAPAAQQAKTNTRTAAADQERKTRAADKRRTRTTSDRRTTSTADRTSKTDTRKRGSKQSTAADSDEASDDADNADDDDTDDADDDDADDDADDDDADTSPDAGTGQRARRDAVARGRCAAGGQCGDEGDGKHKGKQGGSDKGKKGGVLAGQGGVLAPGSRITGQAHGARQGGKGGTGERDDHGARGAGVFGGLVNVPASLRPLAETLLILEDAVPTRLATSWLARKLRNLTVVWLRGRLRHAATAYATERLARHATSLNQAMRGLSVERRLQISRQLQWEIERKYFEKLEQGAKEHIKALETQLGGKLSREARKGARAQLARAEKLLAATRVKPIAGRLPVNHRYAGQWVPRRKLPKKYRDKGLRVTEEGYPDFSPYAIKLPNGKKSVRIKLTGQRRTDDALASKAAGFRSGSTPDGYTWHHVEDGTTMQLVPADLHERIRHTGGTAHYRHRTGDLNSYPIVQD